VKKATKIVTARDMELARARRILRRRGFTPVEWINKVGKVEITVDEVHAADPRFEVRNINTGGAWRSTAADLTKTISRASTARPGEDGNDG